MIILIATSFWEQPQFEYFSTHFFLPLWTRTQIVGLNFWKSASKIGMLGLKCPTIWLKLKKKIQLWFKKEWIWQSSWRIPSGRIRIYSNRFWFDQKMFVDVGVDFGKNHEWQKNREIDSFCCLVFSAMQLLEGSISIVVHHFHEKIRQFLQTQWWGYFSVK